MSLRRTYRGKVRRLPSFTMVEAIIATVIMATMLGAALSAVRSSSLTQYKAADRVRGGALADALMTEILQQSYADPSGTVLFGHELGESTTSRTDCEDVDDYDGWSESPPQNRDGSVIANLSGWTRSVSVAYVNPANLSQTSLLDTGAKRIIVTVKHGNITVATRTAVRSSAP